MLAWRSKRCSHSDSERLPRREEETQTPAPSAPQDSQCLRPICSEARLLRIPHPGFVAEAPRICPAQVVAQSADAAVTGDFVVLDFLRSHDDTGVDHGIVAICLQHLRSFFDSSLSWPGQVLALLLLIEFFEDLLKPLDVTLSVPDVFESFLQFV